MVWWEEKVVHSWGEGGDRERERYVLAQQTLGLVTSTTLTCGACEVPGAEALMLRELDSLMGISAVSHFLACEYQGIVPTSIHALPVLAPCFAHSKESHQDHTLIPCTFTNIMMPYTREWFDCDPYLEAVQGPHGDDAMRLPKNSQAPRTGTRRILSRTHYNIFDWGTTQSLLNSNMCMNPDYFQHHLMNMASPAPLPSPPEACCYLGW